MANETWKVRIARIAALAAEEERLRTAPPFAGRADKVAKALDAEKAELAAVLAGLSGEVAAAKAAKAKRTAQAKAAGKAGGEETAIGRAAGTIRQPRAIPLPIWKGDGDPPIEWRTVDWQRATLHLRRLARLKGKTPNMTQILRAVAAASGLSVATLRRRWFGNAAARKAILDTPLVRWPQRRKSDDAT